MGIVDFFIENNFKNRVIKITAYFSISSFLIFYLFILPIFILRFSICEINLFVLVNVIIILEIFYYFLNKRRHKP